MALKGKWVDKIDGVDVNSANDINQVAQAVIELEEKETGGITQETDPTVPAWAKQSSKPTYTASEVGALPNSTKIPTKTSDLTNDSGFITKAVADLANYYTKSQTYTRDEVNALISAIPKFSISVVSSLPMSDISETTIYLVGGGSGNDLYAEYIYANGKWEILGSQKVDLTGYAKEAWVNTQLSSYLKSSELDAAVESALTEAKESGEFDGADGKDGKDGADGERGSGILKVTTTPSSYTNSTGGKNPIKRMSISTIKSEAKVDVVVVNDHILYGSYLYHIYYLDATYAYMDSYTYIKGSNGTNGADGTSVTVSKVTESTASGVTNVVTFSDGTTLNVKNGKDGKDYSFDPTVYDLPVLELTGDISPIKVSKDNEVSLTYVYGDRNGSCTLKGQGSSSYQMAMDFINAGKAGKFNYTIKFDNAFEAKEGWGSQKKYCLKANWIDHSHSRNVVSCKLWGMSVKARSNPPTQLKNLPNGGAIDGFPVVIMLNGEFHGLYTFNIPKDEWMFGLAEDTTKTQAIFSAHQHSDATQFKGLLKGDDSDFELEFISDKNNTEWATASLNRLITACMNSWGGDLDTEVAKYLDWDSAIDYYIHCVVEKGSDAVDKNFLLTTFDGTKWYFTNYDRDTICGLAWDGSALDRPVSDVKFVDCKNTSKVFELIYRFKTNALKARYQQLRSNILSESRINQTYENFAWAIPSPVAQEDVKKYPTIRGSFVNGIDQICRWMRQRLEACDEWINALPAQETPVAPEEPEEIVNLVPTSTDTNGTVYNGTGYKDGYRLSSSGGVSGTAEPNATHTGFMKVKKGDVIRIKIKGGFAQSGSGNYVCFYNSSFGLIKADYPESWKGGNYGTTETLSDGSVLITGFTANQDGVTTAMEYFRVSLNPAKGANLIVTVNQEIT